MKESSVRCCHLRRLLAGLFEATRDADFLEPPVRPALFRADVDDTDLRTGRAFEVGRFAADWLAGARFAGFADLAGFAAFTGFAALTAGDFAAGSELFFAGWAFTPSLRSGTGRSGSGARAVFATVTGAAAGVPLAGAGGFFGRPLRRAALPAASIASNAAFASAISCECGDVRSRATRSFSAW